MQHFWKKSVGADGFYPSVSTGPVISSFIYYAIPFAIAQEWNSAESPISGGIWLPVVAHPERIIGGVGSSAFPAGIPSGIPRVSALPRCTYGTPGLSRRYLTDSADPFGLCFTFAKYGYRCRLIFDAQRHRRCASSEKMWFFIEYRYLTLAKRNINKPGIPSRSIRLVRDSDHN